MHIITFLGAVYLKKIQNNFSPVQNTNIGATFARIKLVIWMVELQKP